MSGALFIQIMNFRGDMGCLYIFLQKCDIMSIRGDIMGLCYWLFVGWWLEPILFVFKVIFWLFIGIPANILKYTFALAIVIALGALAVAMIATVGAFLIIPTLVISALICIASMLAGKKRKIKK